MADWTTNKFIINNNFHNDVIQPEVVEKKSEKVRESVDDVNKL